MAARDRQQGERAPAAPCRRRLRGQKVTRPENTGDKSDGSLCRRRGTDPRIRAIRCSARVALYSTPPIETDSAMPADRPAERHEVRPTGADGHAEHNGEHVGQVVLGAHQDLAHRRPLEMRPAARARSSASISTCPITFDFERSASSQVGKARSAGQRSCAALSFRVRIVTRRLAGQQPAEGVLVEHRHAQAPAPWPASSRRSRRRPGSRSSATDRATRLAAGGADGFLCRLPVEAGQACRSRRPSCPPAGPPSAALQTAPQALRLDAGVDEVVEDAGASRVGEPALARLAATVGPTPVTSSKSAQPAHPRSSSRDALQPALRRRASASSVARRPARRDPGRTCRSPSARPPGGCPAP